MIERARLLYADPPWSYDNKTTGGSGTSGAVDQYPVMTLEQLADLPIADLCAKSAICASWATVPMLPEALRVLDAWGFAYKTMDVWVKAALPDGAVLEDLLDAAAEVVLGGRVGLGAWYRVAVEFLLYGVRGHVHAPRLPERNVFVAPVRGHSVKPVEARARLVHAATRAFGTWHREEHKPGKLRDVLDAPCGLDDLHAIELFARERAPGWDAIGLGIDGVDVRDALARRCAALYPQQEMFG